MTAPFCPHGTPHGFDCPACASEPLERTKASAPAAVTPTRLGSGCLFDVPDDAELSGDLPRYCVADIPALIAQSLDEALNSTPGGFPDGNAFPGAIDLSFHASEVANV